ncbi:MAG: DivIVA domain-containing protein [Pseudolysinimonas sp.]
MSTTFPRARKLGYDIDQVEDFLEDARRAYHAQPGEQTLVSAEMIRQQAFTMKKHGYAPSHVDSALERLEDAFATKERDAAFRQVGDQAWYAGARANAQELLDRVVRPRGRRFRRVGLFTLGYSVRDVDRMTDQVSAYFQAGRPLSIEDLRTASFESQRGGYNEAQVDMLLDSVIEVMLAVR